MMLDKVDDSLVRVNEEDFFTALKADPRDIMPTFTSAHPTFDRITGYCREWRNQKGLARELFGVSDGGTHLTPDRYWLIRSAAVDLQTAALQAARCRESVNARAQS